MSTVDDCACASGGGVYDNNDVTCRVDSGASKHFLSNVSLFTSWDLGAKIVTFYTTAGTCITSCAVGTVKFEAYSDQRKQRVVALSGAYYVPHQSHNLVAVGQFTHISQDQWKSPDFESVCGKTKMVCSLFLKSSMKKLFGNFHHCRHKGKDYGWVVEQ